nr:HoxN/HupN/NixA family nickel/cobalt transporter [Conexibacter sp. DBS9H8]
MSAFPKLRAGLASLTPKERRSAGLMLATIAALNLGAILLYVLAVEPKRLFSHHQHAYAGHDLGIGLGIMVTAWTLGARHAFDADHIAAIDNSTRKLLAQRGDGERPLGTGFFFALGHSTVLLVVGLAIVIAARSVFGGIVNPNSGFETAGGAAGTLVSVAFLYLIASLNVVVLSGIVGVFRRMRRGEFDEAELERQLDKRGLMYRFFGRWMNSINHTYQMFPVGFIFGIGFDTATEVLLLAGTAVAAEERLPFYAVLCLPLLFAGGMTLCDSLDGFFMNTAYGWAFARPVRRVYYNLMITGLSIAVAFVIGTIEVLQVLGGEFHLTGWLSNWASTFSINTAGIIIVCLFIVIWIAALAYWRFADVEARWERGLAAAAEE